MLLVKEIIDKTVWESFLEKIPEKTFLQSWNWGEFQRLEGNKIWRLGVFDDNNLILVFLVSKIIAKRGIFLLIQHLVEPLLAETNGLGRENYKLLVLKTALLKLKQVGKAEKASFIRIVPLFRQNQENQKLFKELSFRKAPMHANAYEATWKLDLNLPESELFANMRKTTRYLIRQTMKNPDIAIDQVSPENSHSGIESYQKLNQEVSRRQKFVPFSDRYLKNEFNAFLEDNQISLFFGKYKGEIAAGAMVIFWSKTGFYHQAASVSEYAELNIPYLIQWQAIKEAKKRGCRTYDFWGFVDPKEKPNHPWAGPTLFKMGFGGKSCQYLKTQDYPLSLKYWLAWIVELARKKRRGV